MISDVTSLSETGDTKAGFRDAASWSAFLARVNAFTQEKEKVGREREEGTSKGESVQT